MSRTRTIRRAAAVAAVALLAGACSGDDDPVGSSGDAAAVSTTAAATEEATFPITVSSGGVDTEIPAKPEAIVSLAPTATEILYAVGAGDAVVAVDALSNFPADAPVTDLSGYEPNVEAIIANEPDLVVLTDDINDVVAGLEAADVPVLVLPAATSIEDTYDEIEAVGDATGHSAEADAVVAEMRSEIEALVESVEEPAEPLTYYHELDDTFYSVTSKTFIGEIYSLAGLVNVADAADPDGEAFGYPQLSAEYLVAADPSLIFLADTICCGQTADTVAERPGFAGLSAVVNGNVIELNDDIASRWGPRIVDLLATIIEAANAVAA